MEKIVVFRRREINAISTALSAATAGPLDGAPRGFENDAYLAFSKICAVPRRGAMIGFSYKDLELLRIALGSIVKGIADGRYLQGNIVDDMAPRQRKRLADLVGQFRCVSNPS